MGQLAAADLLPLQQFVGLMQSQQDAINSGQAGKMLGSMLGVLVEELEDEEEAIKRWRACGVADVKVKCAVWRARVAFRCC